MASEGAPVARTPRLEDQHERWQKLAAAAQAEHGTLVNPITGDEVDIMQQCVNLQLDTGNGREVGDKDAYGEVVTNFRKRLQQGAAVWVAVNGGKYQKGVVNRVNAEDEREVTYDFQYSAGVQEGGKLIERTFISKDIPRIHMKPRPVLVKGDPAGGKTTFAKQLLIWIVRNDKSRWLVPVLIRVVDLLRNSEFFANDGRDMVDQFLERRYSEDGLYVFLSEARSAGRLLVILDGFDEAGIIQRKLTTEIHTRLCNEVFLVLTSRGMGTTFDAPEFDRFRSVWVKELNEDQQRQVCEKRLGGGPRADAFGRQLRLSPALRDMAKNPLLLNVALAAFEASVLDEAAGGISRGTVYRLALDGMLGSLERAKASSEGAAAGTIAGLGSPTVAVRAVLRRAAYLAHIHDGGRGIRDFRRELVQRAIDQSQVGAAFSLDHWEKMEDLIKLGRLPVLAWFVEDGQDTFRFAHLTFQEFLCAEECLQECLWDESFITGWRDLVCPRGREEIIDREWWQQTIQMFCDLADSIDARTAAGQRLSAAVGEAFLRLHDDSDLDLKEGVNDSNVLTLLSILNRSTLLSGLSFGRPISSDGMTAFQLFRAESLRSLRLRHNSIGPLGLKSLAGFLESGGHALEELDLLDNALLRGAARMDLATVTPHYTCPREYSHYCFSEDLSGLQALLEAVRRCPTLKTLELRSNFLTLEAGLMLFELVVAKESLQEVCGVPVQALRAGRLHELVYESDRFFVEQHAEPFLCTGDAALLLEVLRMHPQAELRELHLRHQALASDAPGIEALFERLGQVVAASPSLETLDMTGFWDAGAKAGCALGRAVNGHPSLRVLKVGEGTLKVAEIREGAFDGGTLNLCGCNVRDCGAGLLSELLPSAVSCLEVHRTGIGDSGYQVLSQCPSLREINGIPLGEFTQECSELCAARLKSAGAVASVLARLALTPHLRKLDLSGSTLTSKSHVHKLTPVYGSASTMCDGGCDQFRYTGSNSCLKCSMCDLDFCSTCAMSRCPMLLLAEVLDRLPRLASLNIADCDFNGGRLMARSNLDEEGYRRLGDSLARHPTLTDLDISQNYFEGPGFPHLARGVARMPSLCTVKVGSAQVDFQSWLSSEEIATSSEWTAAEVLLMAMAIRRNVRLRRLDLSEEGLEASECVVEALVDSLRYIGAAEFREGESPRQAATTRVRLEWLRLGNVEVPFAELQDGTVSHLSFAAESPTRQARLVPLFCLALECGTSLAEVDFCNLDFGDATPVMLGAVLQLAQRSPALRCNGISLRPQLPCAGELRLVQPRQRPMPLGMCLLASTIVRKGCLHTLVLQKCGVSASSLAELLEAMSEAPAVTSLDVSYQPLRGAGVQALADFLRHDKKLRSLAARGIGMPMLGQSLNLAMALETNTTLVRLDLRDNRLHHTALQRLRRTMEELRSVLPMPLEAKLAFLLCNRRLPQHLQLPEMAQVVEQSRLLSEGAQTPLMRIFQYCAQPRELLLSLAEEEED